MKSVNVYIYNDAEDDDYASDKYDWLIDYWYQVLFGVLCLCCVVWAHNSLSIIFVIRLYTKNLRNRNAGWLSKEVKLMGDRANSLPKIH